MNGQNCHPHRLFVPEPVRAVPAPPAIRERLFALRAEAIDRAKRLNKQDRIVWPFAPKH